MIVYQLIPSSSTQPAESQQWNSGTGYIQNPNSQNYLSLLITTEDAQSNNLETNQQPTLTSNILPATITENKLLNAIFPFKLKELSTTPLFSGATLEKKPITAMYTDAKVDGHSIKLILDNRLADSIITKQLMDQLATKTSNGEIDDFFIKVKNIMIPIKVLVMKATQYQALIGNDWLFKTNPEQPTHMHTKRGEKTYLRSLPSFLGQHQTQQAAAKNKKRKKNGKKEKPTTDSNSTYNSYTTPHQSTYHCPKLVCVDCGKKLSSMSACCDDNEEYTSATKFYCHSCIIECFERPKRVEK
ncbi:hypothetical protein G9A89_017752 [Geosiphon pyriformis]|nr:hypothetical protein G9A89_017752 [Geosiphon pyriformis]